ncbi:flagellar hook protein FlgE [Methylotuvimicrobium sp. KM1]|uniref:flagellar hook protein FlgE n=1 Tax=Methylotuvimicrobium sp. KM1 TaxID=3377707 RepID=UPI00384D913D
MSFATGLSGLKAASTDLKTTGNNIANANTTGFKKSRAEFADVYASSFGGVPKTQPGSGVRVTEVAQQFTQGNIEFTENSLDLAISGNGFFTLADDVNSPRPTSFTRNGAFQLDKNGFVVDDRGRFLMAYSPNGTTVEEGFSQGVFQPLFIDTSQGLPSATENINTKINLNGSLDAPAVATFDPTNPNSFNNTTSVTVFDSQGNAHTASMYLVKTATPNQWNIHTYVNGRGIEPGGGVTAVGVTPAATPITFTESGILNYVGSAGNTSVDYGPINLSLIDPNIEVDPLSFDIDFLGSTQLSSPFSVNELNQDGLPAGNLTGIDVTSDGVMFARFSNGGSRPLGQVAMARFPNDQGLAKLGDTSWGESAVSGQPVYGAAGANNFGVMQSAALESSNVDLSEQLVRLIIAQQAYQANAQTISTENTITQTILNIR